MKGSLSLWLSVVGAVGLAAPAVTANEAPMLAEQVANGTLPPLEERLPAEPLVVTPEDNIGTYGGTWRSSMVGGSDQIWLMRMNTHETLVSWDREWSGAVIPNVAESMEVSEDARTFTFRFREGMKWSDGAPFTVDDFLYYFEDVAFNPEVSEVPNANIWRKDEKPKVTRLDDLTVEIVFETPYGLFPIALTSPFAGDVFQQPKHYCSQFHPDYNPEAEAEARAAGADNWLEHYRTKCMPNATDRENFANAERPTIQAWMFDRAYVGGAQQVTMTRNPYYWKVDTEGNQLPYIDGLRVGVTGDAESLVLSALNGEIDFQDRNLNTTTNRGMFMQNAEDAPFRLVEQTEMSNTMLLSLNLTSENEILSKAFNTRDFRVALSHAIDRRAIIDAVNFGFGEPSQPAPAPDTAFYNEELATQYTEYDPEKAKAILDEAGFTVGPNGFRQTPDGERLAFVCTPASNFGDVVSSMELVVNYWKAVGIDARLNTVDRSTLIEMLHTNQHECVPWTGMSTGPDVILDARIILPSTIEAYWARGWAAWYLDLPNAVEPPAEVREALELYEQAKSVASEEARNDLMRQITDIAAENFWVMGLSTTPSKYIVVNDDMANVPDPSIGGWNYLSPSVSGVEQFYFDR